MKNRTNQLLALVALVSSALCVWAWFFDIRLLLFLPALPFFCLQLLLCRLTGRRILRAIPMGCVALFALAGAGIYFTFPGWDGLLGFIMLWASVSPTAGCLLAGLVCGLPRWITKRKGVINGG